jgi:transcriptional regulator with XRE-family HTH domain
MREITAEMLAAAAVHPVRAARALRGLSQRDVEARAGLPATALSRIEAGSGVPDPVVQQRLAMALGVDVDVLFPAHISKTSKETNVAYVDTTSVLLQELKKLRYPLPPQLARLGPSGLNSRARLILQEKGLRSFTEAQYRDALQQAIREALAPRQALAAAGEDLLTMRADGILKEQGRPRTYETFREALELARAEREEQDDGLEWVRATAAKIRRDLDRGIERDRERWAKTNP